jgi:hypothetical protein
MKTVPTLCLKYHRTFDVGELVKPASPQCPLPLGEYEVTRCVVPSEPNGEALVLVKGRNTPIPTATLMSANAEREFIDSDDMPLDESEFLACQLRFPLRLIRDEEGHDRALAVRDAVLAQVRRSEAVEEYLRTLVLLIESYGRKDAPPPPYQTDGEVFGFLLETREVSAREVARATGIQSSSLSRVRTGQAQFTRGQITALIAYFNIGPKVFFRRPPEPELIPTFEEFEARMRHGYRPMHG